MSNGRGEKDKADGMEMKENYKQDGRKQIKSAFTNFVKLM